MICHEHQESASPTTYSRAWRYIALQRNLLGVNFIECMCHNSAGEYIGKAVDDSVGLQVPNTVNFFNGKMIVTDATTGNTAGRVLSFDVPQSAYSGTLTVRHPSHRRCPFLHVDWGCCTLGARLGLSQPLKLRRRPQAACWHLFVSFSCANLEDLVLRVATNGMLSRAIFPTCLMSITRI